MKKKAVALLLCAAVFSGLIPFTIKAKAQTDYSSGLNDTASYAFKIPDGISSAGQAYHYTTGGVSLPVVRENGENFLVYGQSLLGSSINTTMYGSKVTYGISAGVSDDIDMSSKTAFAIRIKIKDYNPAYMLQNSQMRIFMSANGQFSSNRKDQNTVPLWLDKKTGALTKMFVQGGWWEVCGFQTCGEMDGWMIIPFGQFSSTVTAAYLKDNYRGIQFFFDTLSISGSRKASNWQNKEFLLGDQFFIESAEGFAAAHRPAVKYGTGYDDGAKAAFIVPGYRSFYGNYYGIWAGPGVAKSISDPTVAASDGGYIHFATIAGKDRAIEIKTNAGYDGGNLSTCTINTYEGVDVDATSSKMIKGIPDEVGFDSKTAFAVRAAVKGGDPNKISRMNFYLNVSGLGQQRCGSGITYIDYETLETTEIPFSNGYNIKGDLDGWFIVPFSGWGTYITGHRDVFKSSFTGIQIFFNEGFSDKTYYQGDVYFIDSAEKFLSAHSLPKISATSTDSSISVVSESGVLYSSDGENWSGNLSLIGLDSDTAYTIYAKYQGREAVKTETVYTSPYKTHLNDGASVLLKAGENKYYNRAGGELGWCNGGITKTPAGIYSSGTGLFTCERDGKWYIDFDYQEEYGTDASVKVNFNNITRGENGFDPEMSTDNLNYLAYRFKIEGGQAGTPSRFDFYWKDWRGISDFTGAYFIDYKTNTIRAAESLTFTDEFDGWFVMPISGITALDGENRQNNRSVMFGENGCDNVSVWLHNGSSCTHMSAPYSDWSGRSLLVSDIVAFENPEQFNSVHFDCEQYGHNYKETVVPPTCISGGYTESVCTICGDSYRFAETSALSGTHSFSNSIVAPTCAGGGYTLHTCTVCNYSYTDNQTAPLAHTYTSKAVAPTYKADGYTEHTCVVCGASYRDNTVPKLIPDTTIGISMFHFSSFCDNYTDGASASENYINEAEDVLTAGYVNTLFASSKNLEETIFFAKKYNCKFWFGPGKFYSDKQKIGDYVENVEDYVDRIIAADGWDEFLGFNWDEPLWGGMNADDFYTMTKTLYERWGKRNFPVFALGEFDDSVGYNKITIKSMKYVTDAGWDSYSWDVRESADNIPGQKNQLNTINSNYGLNLQSGRDYYRWIQSKMLSFFDHDVNTWFFPSAYPTGTYAGVAPDEDYSNAQLSFFRELLLEQENPGGLALYTYATFNDKTGLEKRLLIPDRNTGEQKLFPETEKWPVYSEHLKAVKAEFDKSYVLNADEFPDGVLNITAETVNSLTYQIMDDYEYSIDGGVNYERDGVFSGLSEDTAYTIRARRISTGNHKDFTVSTSKQLPYASGLNDTASYVIKMPNDIDVLSSYYGWIGSTLGRNKDDTDFCNVENGLLHLTTIDGQRYIKVQSNNVEGSANVYACFGDSDRSKSDTGFSASIDSSKLTAFAVRIRIEGGSTEQRSVFSFYINQRNTGGRALTFIDAKTGNISHTESCNGIGITGEVDGWLIMPFDIFGDFDFDTSTTNLEWLRENFNGVQIWIHGSNCGHGAKSYTDWTDKTLYVGDVMAIEDAGTFINAHGVPADISPAYACADRIKVNANDGEEYSLDGLNWNSTGIFEGLTAGATYTVYAKNTNGTKYISTSVTLASSHNYGAFIIAPTCTQQGYTRYVCRVCKDEYCDNLKPAAHSYVTTVIAPTETEQGYTSHVCSVCSDSYNDNYTNPTGGEPSVPTDRVNNVVATPTDVDVTVTWDAFAKATIYYIRLYDASNMTTHIALKNTTGTSVTFPGLEMGKNYVVKVIAKAGTYLDWAKASEVPTALVLGNRVVGTTAVASGKAINVNWMAYPGADFYYVQVFEKSTGNRVLSSKATKNSAVISTLVVPEVTYDVKVIAHTSAGYQDPGVAIAKSAKITAQPPETVELVSVLPGSMRVKWSAVRNTNMYYIQVKDKNGTVVRVTQTTNTAVSIPGLSENSTYSIAVQARVLDDAGAYIYSGYGPGTQMTTTSFESMNLLASASGKVVSLNWSIPTNIEKYYVYEAKGAARKYIATVTGSEASSYSFRAAAGTHTYVVLARLFNGSIRCDTPYLTTNSVVVE